MRVVAYARVSTNEDEQIKSFNEQQEHFKHYCKEKGYNLVGMYADKGRSGKNVDREEFQRMLYDAGLNVKKQPKGNTYNIEITDRKPLFDYILVKDVSRFSRSVTDGKLIVKQLREMGVHVLFEGNNINTKTHLQGNDLVVDQMLNMLFSGAESESLMTSQRQKQANLSRLERGEFIFKTLPYGYMKDKDGKVIQNDKQAEVVRYIFNRVKKVGLRTISRELEEKEIKPLKAEKWSYNVLKTMITNTLYYGTVTALKRKKEQITSVRKKTDKEEQIVLPNKIENPILTYEEWKESNDAFLSRRNEGGKGNKPCEIPDIFSKKLICGYCGSKLVRNSTKANENGKKYYNYTCQTKRERRACTLKNLSFNLMSKLFDSVEPRFTTSGFGTANTDEVIYSKIKVAKAVLNEKIREMEQELFKVEKKIRSIQEEILTEDNPEVKKNWKDMLNEVANQRNDIERELYILKSNNLDNLKKLTKATKQKLIELSKEEFTQEQKLEQLNYVEVFDERVIIHFDSISYQPIIDELNVYLPKGEKINDTIEKRKAEHELFRSAKHQLEFYENQEQT